MSPTGTEGNGMRMSRTPKLVIAAVMGLGLIGAVPVLVNAAQKPGATTAPAASASRGATAPIERGHKVTVTPETPAAVKKALRSSGPVVVAFLLPGVTEDEIVAKRLNALRRERGFRDTTFITYRIVGRTKLGDLPTLFDLKYTPAVAVIQGNDRLSNVWRGLVDEDLIAQSILDARAATPKPPKPKAKAKKK